MRSRMRFSRKVKTVCLILIVAIISYAWGFGHGQASVYEKARNDAKFYKQVWGNN